MFKTLEEKPIRLLEVVVLSKILCLISTLKQVDLRQVLPKSAYLVEIQVFWSFRFYMLDRFSFVANNFIARL